MLEKEEILLIIYFVAIAVFLAAFVIVFFIAFQRRKNKLLLERYEAKKRFERELVDSQLEIQNQTLKNVGWELHDNVGQLLSVANMQLNVLLASTEGEARDQIDDTKEVVTAVVEEVRSLSKTLNSDIIRNNGLVPSIQTDLERFNRLNFLHADFKMDGEVRFIKDEDEIIIFRILQEFFSNVIKHARAKHLFVHLNYTHKDLKIEAKDDGIGFNPLNKSGNSGLQNMKSRAELLNSSFELTSEPEVGTNLRMIYPYPTHD